MAASWSCSGPTDSRVPAGGPRDPTPSGRHSFLASSWTPPQGTPISVPVAPTQGLTACSGAGAGSSSSCGSGPRQVAGSGPCGECGKGQALPCRSCPRADQAAPTSLKSQERGCGGLWWFGRGAGPRWGGGSQLGAQRPVQMEKDGLPRAGTQEHPGKWASGSTGPRPHWGERGARWALGTLLSGSRYDSQTGPRTLQTHTFKSTQTLSQRSAGSRAHF